MKQFFRWIPIMLLTGCLAEGSLPEEPRPDVSFPDQRDMDNVQRPDAAEDSGTLQFGEVCDPFEQDCAGKCVPNPATDEPTCLQTGEERSAGSACETITQCEQGTHCASIPADPTNLCRPMCDPSAPDCPSSMTCSARLSSIPWIGLCVEPAPACDIYAQDCTVGDCVVTTDNQGQVGTFCGEAGTRGENESCGGGFGECQVSYVCVRLAGVSLATCEQVCKPGVVDCRASESCTGTAASSGVNFCQ